MTKTHRTIATDSEVALHDVIGDDSTATFEADPKFEESNPGAEGSSANVEEQRETDDSEDSDEEILDDDDDAEDEEDDEEDDEEEEEEEVEAAAASNR